MKDALAHASALLGVELHGVEVVLVQGRAERLYVVRHCRRARMQGHVVAVHEVDVFLAAESGEQGAAGVADGVPPHMGHLVLVVVGDKTAHLGIEYAQAVGVSFLGVAAHQLHAQTDAQDGLAQG